jgi:streptogramin lyase
MKARPLKLNDVHFGRQWTDKVLDRWLYEDFQADPAWRTGWTSMDCCCYDDRDDRVYLGITSFAADVFKAYDRHSGAFADLGFDRVADGFDAKFHRSLVKGPDGCIYGAIALLHDVDRYLEAPGGSIVRYDPRSGSIQKLCTPLPHVYIQSIALDSRREVIYGQCFAPEHLVSLDLKTGRSTDHGLVGTGIAGMTQGENLCLDDDGCVWFNWSLTRAWQDAPGVDAARVGKLEPSRQRLTFLHEGLPRPDGSRGFVKAEAFFNFHDGLMYASGANGSLYRLDPRTGRASYLFTPITDRPSRLASMALGPDGCAYGVTGRAGNCQVLRFDFPHTRYELIGQVEGDGETCWQVHDVCFAPDGTLYACENDNPSRSGYLWEIVLS